MTASSPVKAVMDATGRQVHLWTRRHDGIEDTLSIGREPGGLQGGHYEFTRETAAELLPLLQQFVDDGRITSEPRDCGALLWKSETTPGDELRSRNGILTALHDGIHHMVPAAQIHARETSVIMDRQDLPLATEGAATRFHYSEVHDALCKRLGLDRLRGVRAGYDGFYHFTVDRTFREGEQLKLVDDFREILKPYVINSDSVVVIDTGRIEIVLNVPPPPPPNAR